MSEPIKEDASDPHTGFPDELTRYVFCYFKHLLTSAEVSAWMSIIRDSKAATMAAKSDDAVFSSDFREQLVTDHLREAEQARAEAPKDPVIKFLLERGADDFFISVSLRILRDHSDEVTLNLCPKCLALCRTPSAKQCRKCFHRWHDKIR